MHLRRMQKLKGVYSTTIPVEMVRYLNWRHGDYLVFQLSEENDLVLRKLNPKEFPHLFKNPKGDINNG